MYIYKINLILPQWNKVVRNDGCQEIFAFGNKKVHFYVHMSQFLDSTLVWYEFKTSHRISIRLLVIMFFCLCLHLSTSGFQAEIGYAFIMSPSRPTCPTYLVLLDWLTPIICSEEYNVRSSLIGVSSSLCTCSLLNRNVPYITLFSLTLNWCSSLRVGHQVDTHRKRQIDYSFVCFNRYVYIHIGHGKTKYAAMNVHQI
jgi:hypothetical protein